MKLKLLNPLLIPVFLLFICGAICLYFYVEFNSHMPVEKVSFEQLQKKVQAMTCQSLNKDKVISIARRLLESSQIFSDLLLTISSIFFTIGIVNLAVIFKYLKAKN